VAAGRDPRRDFLLSLFQAGLAAVNGRTRMRAALDGRDDLRKAWVIAAGKAASSMTLGALDALGPRVERVLVVTRDDGLDPRLAADPRVQLMPGGHPVPDASSLAAGRAALQMAAEVTPDRPVLLLVSGGASSLLEALPDGVSLDALRRFTAWALGSGRDIRQVNALRRRFSLVKDGRLLSALSRGRVEGYYLSDVPGDDPALVGSGLLAREEEPQALPGDLPDWVLEMIHRGVPRAGRLPDVPLCCVGCLDDARAAIVAAARPGGRRGPLQAPHAVRGRTLGAGWRDHGRASGAGWTRRPEPAPGAGRGPLHRRARRLAGAGGGNGRFGRQHGRCGGAGRWR